jgi:ABC-type multidrug transport system fused ATPase/permease subunit
VAFVAFSIFSLISDTPLTPALIFPAISLFQLLESPLGVLPIAINEWVEAYVSANRIGAFLASKELQQDAVIRSSYSTEEHVPPVEVLDAHFTWSSGTDSTLSGISLSVSNGKLLAIVGRVGSGKSSLLFGILGEMLKLSGTVQLRGNVAYTAQTPWLLSATVKENILFGAEYDEELYETVIEACALVDDLAMLEDGDETQVGENGVALSGGQKARVSLARAIYARADVYLLDDPLSSVDAHVARHLFDKVIGPNGLLRGKARIMCTNAVPFCQQVDELIMLRDGQIVERGTFQSVLANQGDIKKLIDEFGNSASQNSTSEEIRPSDDVTIAPSVNSTQSSNRNPRQESAVLMRRPSTPTLRNRHKEALKSLKAPQKVLEHKEKGSVKYNVYKTYWRANGVANVAIALASTVVKQVFSLMTTLWLKHWSSNNQHPSGDPQLHLGYYLAVYGLLGFFTGLTAFVNGVTLFSVCAVRSARVLHDRMFAKVLRAPMSFFDS